MICFLLFLFTALITSAHGTSGPGHSFLTGIKSPQKDLQANERAKRNNMPQYNQGNFDDAWEKVSEEMDRRLKAFYKDQTLKDSSGSKDLRKYFLQNKGKKSDKPEKTTIPSYPAIPNPTGEITPFELDKFEEAMGEDLEPVKTMNSRSIILGAATAMCVVIFIVLTLVIVLCRCLYKAICKIKPMQNSV